MSELQTSRTRKISWEDPTASVQTGKTISGMEYLKAMQSGELPPPPIAVLMGMWITEVDEGRVVFAFYVHRLPQDRSKFHLLLCW